MNDYVYIVIPACKTEIRVVVHDEERIGLKLLQKGVGGLITLVPLAYASTALEGVDVWADDEGFLEGLKPNIGVTVLTGVLVVGDVVLCKSDGEGNSIAFPLLEGITLAKRLTEEIKKFFIGDSDIERFDEIPDNILHKAFSRKD